MYLNKKKTQKKLVLQKNRKKIIKTFFFEKFLFLKSSQKNKSYFIFSKNTFFIELKVLKKIIKSLRKLIRKKKFKAYLYFCANYAWFKKSKNARMGRGKGRFNRFVFLTQSIKPLLIFQKISKNRVIKFKKMLNILLKKFEFF